MLTISLHNRSDEPVYLMADIRRIRYDDARRVLGVQLSEHEPLGTSADVRPPLPPRYRVVGAGEMATIVHPLSSPITFLESPTAISTLTTAARARHVVRLPEDVEAIACTLAYERRCRRRQSTWRPGAVEPVARSQNDGDGSVDGDDAKPAEDGELH